MAVPLAELIALFAGDEFSEPCPTAVLAERICEHVRPGDVRQLQARIYGHEWPPDEIAAAECSALAEGFMRWTRGGRRFPA